MNQKDLKIRKILFIFGLLFFSSCQLTQAVDDVKSDISETSIVENDELRENQFDDSSQTSEPIVESRESNEEKSNEDLLSYLADFFKTEDKKSFPKEEKIKKENPEGHTEKGQDLIQQKKEDISIEAQKDFYKPDKLEGEKRIIPLSVINKFEKSKQFDTKSNFYKPEKAKDEKRILSFFTGFFEKKNDKGNNALESDSVQDSIISGYEKQEEQPVIDPQAQEIKTENEKEVEMSEIEDSFPDQSFEDEINEERIEQVKTNENFMKIEEKADEEVIFLQNTDEKSEEESLVKKIDEEFVKEENENYAFFDLKKPKSKKIKKKRLNNYVGLLLPLTGEKRSAGNLVLNTFRYSLLRKPMDINFKIYDTKGTENGVIQAAIKGKKDGVQTFVGPIFSDETRALKNFFKSEKNLIFFSLSPDISNVSENIIVSGQNPEDQMVCISEDLIEKNIDKLLLIHHDDRYGEIVKESLNQGLANFDSQRKIKISFLKLSENLDINNEIKSISQFEKRKKNLKKKKLKISKDKNIPIDEKKRELKKLDRQLTLDVPYDAVIVASEGDNLLEILSHLAFYDINAANTLIYGTSLWEDTDKTDKVYENTYYVTNLKTKSESFSKNFKDVFSVEPSSVNFHLVDLIDLVNAYKHYEQYPENKIHIGEFTNTLLEMGSLKRETFLKRNKKKNEVEDISSCQLDVL